MSSYSDTQTNSGSDAGLYIAVGLAVVFVNITILVVVCKKCSQKGSSSDNPSFHDPSFPTLTMDNFLNDMEREKPSRFTSQQLRIATDNFTNLLGSGGFGSVYKGLFSNGTLVAVKVLRGTLDKRIDEQFMAEVSTLGSIHHFNLVRLS